MATNLRSHCLLTRWSQCERLPRGRMLSPLQRATYATSSSSRASPVLNVQHRCASARTRRDDPTAVCSNYVQKRYMGRGDEKRMRSQNRENMRRSFMQSEDGGSPMQPHSQASMVRNMIREGEMPDDSPLFPGTLIMPGYRDLWAQIREDLMYNLNFKGRKEIQRKYAKGLPLTGEEQKVEKVRAKRRLGEPLSEKDKSIMRVPSGFGVFSRFWWETLNDFRKKQWERTKRKGQDYFAVQYVWHYAAAGVWDRWILRWWKPSQAKDWGVLGTKRRNMHNTLLALYTDMNTGLYSQDVDKLKETCCSTLQKDLVERCRRQRTKPREWHFKHLESRCVSHRATKVPVDDGTDFPMLSRQAVFWVKSVQQIDGGNKVPVEEYVVMQQRLYNGKEEPWKLWGTLQEATQVVDWHEVIYPDPTLGGNSRYRPDHIPATI